MPSATPGIERVSRAPPWRWFPLRSPSGILSLPWEVPPQDAAGGTPHELWEVLQKCRKPHGQTEAQHRGRLPASPQTRHRLLRRSPEVPRGWKCWAHRVACSGLDQLGPLFGHVMPSLRLACARSAVGSVRASCDSVPGPPPARSPSCCASWMLLDRWVSACSPRRSPYLRSPRS